MKKNKIDTIMGFGKLNAKKQVEVMGADGKTTTYDAKHVILATGGRARQLPTLPIDGKKVIGYREAMVLPTQPKSMIIVGSGAIGVEFAYFYNNMGTKVTIVEFMPRIVPVEDEDISKELEKSYKKKGIDIMTKASVEKVDTSKFNTALRPGIISTIKTDSELAELRRINCSFEYYYKDRDGKFIYSFVITPNDYNN
jgi:dihydrolipoamide dehydrogenase